MNKIVLSSIIAFSLTITTALAGDGHNHGNSAFENNQSAATEFELTATQIHNLHLQTAKVSPFEFYETIAVPMIVDTMHNTHALAHGFVYEGSDILKIQKGQAVTFKLDILPEKEFHGNIVRIEDMIDPQSRLYSIYATIDENFPKNTQGLKGEMTIRITPVKKALGVPVTALQGEFGDYFVFIQHDQHFERRAVTKGYQTGNMIEVEGVKEGETVVTIGSYQLRYATGKPLTTEENHSPEKENTHASENQHIAE